MGRIGIVLLGLLWVLGTCTAIGQETPEKTIGEPTARVESVGWRTPSDPSRDCDWMGSSGCDSLTSARCFSRQQLTGDWFGIRPRLQDSGIGFKGTVTQFGFGIVGGINNPVVPPPFEQGDTFKYTGRAEYDFHIDLEKLLGCHRTKLLVGVQHWWGQFANISLNTGSFAPPVFPAALPPTPNGPGNLYLTDFLLTQPLPNGFVVFAGKKNVIGTADQDIFAGGDGTDQFVNQALIANPSYLLALPYSSFTAGVAMQRSWGGLSAYVWDPTDRTRRSLDLDGLFSRGVIVGSQIRFLTKFFNKPGEHHFGGIWKKLGLTDLSVGLPPADGFPNQPVRGSLPTRDDSYTIYYGFDQYVGVYPGVRRSPLPNKPPRGWGFFGRASISDGNPTPFEYFLSAGIGGDSRVGGDRGDSFGIGWFYTGVTSKFGPIAQAIFEPRNGTGVELYYKFQLRPWLALTPDVQYIHPAISRFTSGDDAFVYGLRLNLLL